LLKRVGGLCIKCGQCCQNLGKRNEFPVITLVDLSVTRCLRTGIRIYGQCKYLEYHAEFDNGVDDLGFRCKVWGTDKLPIECKEFPTGKERNLREELDVGRPIRFSRLPLCPFKFEVV